MKVILKVVVFVTYVLIFSSVLTGSALASVTSKDVDRPVYRYKFHEIVIEDNPDVDSLERNNTEYIVNMVSGINNDGIVVGTYIDPYSQMVRGFAYNYVDGSYIEVAEDLQDCNVYPQDVNSVHVVGYALCDDHYESFRFNMNTGQTDIYVSADPTTLNTQVVAINENGVAVGTSNLGTSRVASVWTDPSSPVNLGPFVGEYSYAFGISNNGVIVGSLKDSEGKSKVTFFIDRVMNFR